MPFKSHLLHEVESLVLKAIGACYMYMYVVLPVVCLAYPCLKLGFFWPSGFQGYSLRWTLLKFHSLSLSLVLCIHLFGSPSRNRSGSMRLIGRGRPNSAKNPQFPRESQLLHQNIPMRSPSMSIPNQSNLTVNAGHRPYQTFSPSSSQPRTRPPLPPGVISLQQNNDFLGDCKWSNLIQEMLYQ